MNLPFLLTTLHAILLCGWPLSHVSNLQEEKSTELLQNVCLCQALCELPRMNRQTGPCSQSFNSYHELLLFLGQDRKIASIKIISQDNLIKQIMISCDCNSGVPLGLGTESFISFDDLIINETYLSYVDQINKSY